VRPVNSGMSDTGSITTKNTTKNFSDCSNIDAVRQKMPPWLRARLPIKS
jgi:hypothetical protein